MVIPCCLVHPDRVLFVLSRVCASPPMNMHTHERAHAHTLPLHPVSSHLCAHIPGNTVMNLASCLQPGWRPFNFSLPPSLPPSTQPTLPYMHFPFLLFFGKNRKYQILIPRAPPSLFFSFKKKKHLFFQFYNVGTDCLEASTEVVRFNRDTSAKSWQSEQLAKRGRSKADQAAAASAGAALGPVVEHVAFSSDGKVWCVCVRVFFWFLRLCFFWRIAVLALLSFLPRRPF